MTTIRLGEAIEVVEEQYPPVPPRIEDYHRDHRAIPYFSGLTLEEKADTSVMVVLFEYDRFEQNREGHFASYLVARMTTDVNIKRLPPSEQKLFGAADQKECGSIVRLGAVRVHWGAAAEAQRRQWPDIIMGSRLV